MASKCRIVYYMTYIVLVSNLYPVYIVQTSFSVGSVMGPTSSRGYQGLQ